MKKVLKTTGGYQLNAELQKYTRHKLAELGRRIPRAAREAAVCNVKFTQKRRKSADNKMCTVQLAVEGKKFVAQETTQHMYTALDIAVVDIVQQLTEYKRERRRARPRKDPHDWSEVTE